jgi:hypothetical protein
VTTPLPDVAGLPDSHAIRLLTLVADHTTALPDPTQLRRIDTRLREAAALDQQPDQPGSASPVTAGDLARATLLYLATSPQHQRVVARVATIPAEATRLEPATLTIGALVVLALQTEIKLSRDQHGHWKLNIHKQAMRDSTLANLITKLLTFSRQPTDNQQPPDHQLPPSDTAG